MAKEYETYLFRDEVYPEVEKALDKSITMLFSSIRRYLDRNSNVLSSSGFGDRLFFTDKDKVELFQRTNTRPNDIKNYIKKTNVVDPSWILSNNPEQWIFVMCIKYCKDHRREEELNLMIMYYTCYLYSSLQYKYFKYCNDNVMDYTINNLSNKYDIKKLGNVQKTLFKISINCYETYSDYFDNFTDLNMKDYSMNLWTRLNNMLNGISVEYYKNVEEGKYLNKEMDNMSSDKYFETDNISGLINTLTQKSTNYIISAGCDYKTANLAAKMVGVSQPVVKNAVENIIKNEAKTINEFINKLLQQNLVIDKQDPTKITSKDFIVYCNKLYTKSNTTEKNVIRIKEILDMWLNNNSEKYVKTERVATKSNFRKAIYFYFVLMIQKASLIR